MIRTLSLLLENVPSQEQNGLQLLQQLKKTISNGDGNKKSKTQEKNSQKIVFFSLAPLGRGGKLQTLSVTFTLRTSLLDVLGRPYMMSCKVF